MSQMMMPPPGPGLGAPPPDMGPPPDAGGGLPPSLMAALGGGAPSDTNSTDLLAQGPMAGSATEEADEPQGDDPLAMVRDAIALLRKAGEIETDDQRSHAIDKVQADLQKILASESQKTDKLRSALGG